MKPYFAMPEDGWYNIAIAGEFPHATGYVQVLDSDAFKAIVEDVHEQQGKPNWPGILIDFDHASLDTAKPSTAAGWLTDIEERPDGLWARIRWSDCGQKSLEGGEFRFVSPVWMLADCEELGEKRVRPKRIASCAITNAPNIRGMVPLTNRTEEKGVPLSPTGRALPIQERVEVPRAALDAIEKLENRILTEKQRKLLWARNGQWYGGNGGSPYQNAAKAGREAASKEGATPGDIIKAKKEARDQSKLMHDYLKRKANPEIRDKERQRRQEKTSVLPGKKIKRIKKATSGDVTWEKKDSGFKKYGRKLKRGRQLSADPKARSDSRADEALRRLGLLNRARLAAFLANTSWEDMTDQQRRWWWAQMGGGVNPVTGEALGANGGGIAGTAVNPYTGESPWANEGTPSNPYASLYGNDMSQEESAFWREVYGNANDPNWNPSEEFGTTSDVDGLFSPEGWAAHQKLSADLNQQLRDEYDRIARQEAIDYQNNLPAFTAPSTWDYFSAAVEDFGAGMAYGVGNLIDAIADLPQQTITGIPDLAALIAKGGSWLVGGNGSVAGKLQTFADAVHDFVDPKAQWAKDKLGLSQMIDELGRNYSGSDWAAKTSKVSASVFAAAVDMLVGLGGLAYGKGPEGIVKLGGTLNDATKIELGLVSKEQILARDIREAIRKINIEEMTKNLDADVLKKFAKQDLDDAVRQLDEALDLNRAMSAQRKMEEIREIERKWANIDAQRMRIPAEEARHADDLAAHEAKLAREKAAQEWYDSNILKADQEAEAARLANPNSDAEARALARENPASLGKMETPTPKPATVADDAARATEDAAARAEAAAKAKFGDSMGRDVFEKAEAKRQLMQEKLNEALGRTSGAEGVKPATKGNLDDAVSRISDNPFEEAERRLAQMTRSDDYSANGRPAQLFAEQHPDWVKIENGNGTVHFEKPAAATKGNLDDAVSRLDVAPTKNEVVGGMYEAASRGESYTDDAGRLLVDNGQVTAAGERAIKQGAAEVSGAAKGNPWQKLEDAAAQVRAGDAAEDTARATRGALDDAVDHMKPTAAPHGTTGGGTTPPQPPHNPDPDHNLQDYIESLQRREQKIGEKYSAMQERKEVLDKKFLKGELKAHERIDREQLKRAIKEQERLLESYDNRIILGKSKKMQRFWDEMQNSGKEGMNAFEAAIERLKTSNAEATRASMEVARQTEQKAQRVKDALDTVLVRMESILEQPSVAKTARVIDALNGGAGKSGAVSSKVLLPLLGTAVASLYAAHTVKGLFDTFGSSTKSNMVVVPEDSRTRTQSLTSPPPQLDVPVAPDGTVLWYHLDDKERDRSQNPAPMAPFRVQDESGALLDAKGRVRGYEEGTEPAKEETGYDWTSMGIEGNRTAADDKPHLMDAIRASAPGVSELREALAAVEPQYVKIERKIPPAEPTAEQVEMVRQNAGVTVKQNAESLKIRINQLEQERADLQARTYAVPVPEMRPTEYQNIQQVRAAAAAKPGATSTSIIAAVNKAQRQNSDVSHLKTELTRAAGGARTDKQKAKAAEEVLRRFNAAYYDAVQQNETNDKNAAKRIARIESQLDTLHRAYEYAQERAKNAEDRAEEKLRNQTRRESEKAERKQEREQREVDRKARYEASLKVKALKAGIRSLERQATSEYKHNQEVWRLVMEGVTEGKQEFHNAALELEPRLDWNAAVSFMRGVYGSTKDAKDKKTGRPRTEKERKGLAKGQVFGIELPLLEEVAG